MYHALTPLPFSIAAISPWITSSCASQPSFLNDVKVCLSLPVRLVSLSLICCSVVFCQVSAAVLTWASVALGLPSLYCTSQCDRNRAAETLRSAIVGPAYTNCGQTEIGDTQAEVLDPYLRHWKIVYPAVSWSPKYRKGVRSMRLFVDSRCRISFVAESGKPAVIMMMTSLTSKLSCKITSVRFLCSTTITASILPGGFVVLSIFTSRLKIGSGMAEVPVVKARFRLYGLQMTLSAFCHRVVLLEEVPAVRERTYRAGSLFRSR